MNSIKSLRLSDVSLELVAVSWEVEILAMAEIN